MTHTTQSVRFSVARKIYGCVTVLSVAFVYAVLAQPLLAVKVAANPQDIRITAAGFSYQVGPDGGRREYRFSQIAYVEAQGHSVCFAQAANSRPEINSSLSLDDAHTSIATSLADAFDTGNDKGGSCLPLFWDHKESAVQFANALNRLIRENSAEVRAQRDQQFQQKADEWRAAGSKVDVPEEAQRHFVIAQQAFQDKNFQHQADELSAALQIYPTWPAEQFDLALVLGELNRYSEAIQHMQMYLNLAPEAPDAQRAKQQIWIWQDKMGGGNN